MEAYFAYRLFMCSIVDQWAETRIIQKKPASKITISKVQLMLSTSFTANG